MNCPVTCGRPTRMSAEAFARMCAARRDKDNKYCADCNGRPPEVEVINMGGKAMASSKTSKEIVEAVGPLKAELEELRQIVDEVSATLRIEPGAVIGAVKTMVSINNRNVDELDQAKARVAKLEAELDAAKAAVDGLVSHTQIGCLDTGADIYRDALADFAVRVLSGGVAVSFHEARP